MNSYLRDPGRLRLSARSLRRSLAGRFVSVFRKGDYLVIALPCSPLLTASTVESVPAAVVGGLPRLHRSTVLRSASAHLAPLCDQCWLLLSGSDLGGFLRRDIFNHAPRRPLGPDCSFVWSCFSSVSYVLRLSLVVTGSDRVLLFQLNHRPVLS